MHNTDTGTFLFFFFLLYSHSLELQIRIEINYFFILIKYTMTWQPVASGLEQIIQLLRESQSPDTETQRQVQQVKYRLDSFGKVG